MQKAQFFSNIQDRKSKCRYRHNYLLVQCIAWVGDQYAEKYSYAFVKFVYMLSFCITICYNHFIPLLTERHNYLHCINVCTTYVK